MEICDATATITAPLVIINTIWDFWWLHFHDLPFPRSIAALKSKLFMPFMWISSYRDCWCTCGWACCCFLTAGRVAGQWPDWPQSHQSEQTGKRKHERKLMWKHVQKQSRKRSVRGDTHRTHYTDDSLSQEAGVDVIRSFSSPLKQQKDFL